MEAVLILSATLAIGFVCGVGAMVAVIYWLGDEDREL